MPKPGEHKTVQTRILKYAEEIGWTFVPRPEADKRRGLNAAKKPESLYFNALLYKKVREFNPLYDESDGALVGLLRRLHSDIHGNREFLDYLRNQGKFFHKDENRERDLLLIDYDRPERNVYEVTEEFYWHNGRYGNREDVVFLINGIPITLSNARTPARTRASLWASTRYAATTGKRRNTSCRR